MHDGLRKYCFEKMCPANLTPRATIFVPISDLYEGGNNADMQAHATALVRSGVQVITLPAQGHGCAGLGPRQRRAALRHRGLLLRLQAGIVHA
jgi:hypothetical protein